MKKISFIILCFLVCGTMVFAGGSNQGATGSSGGSSSPVTINALFMKQAGYSEDDINPITAQFEKDNPGIKVNQTWVAYEELQPKILAAAASGGLDVIPGDCIWTAQFAQAGLVKDLTTQIKALNLDDIWQGAIDSIMYKGKYYGIPFLNDVKYLFYNKKMLQDAGISAPPKTWDEFIQQCQIIKQKGIVQYPVAWCWSQAEALICDYTAISGGFGGQFTDANGNPTLNTPQNKAALDFMYGTIQSGLTNPKSLEMLEDDVLSTFCSGNAAFGLNWTYMYNSAQDPTTSQIVGQCGIAIIPGTAAKTSATVNGGMSSMMTSGCKNPDQAWKYMMYLSSKDVQAEHSLNALPIWKSLYDDPRVVSANPDVVPVAKIQYAYLLNRPMVPYYGELSNTMQVEIQNVLLGKESSDAALANIQAKALTLQKQ
ncbi:MAG: extracellular solute-binding protein [Treponema sp.]|nr:extracellular solute-binding protein [Treponema sp.]